MTDIYNFVGTGGPIYQLDDTGSVVQNPSTTVTGKWLLAAELYMTNGAVFYCKGTTHDDGDCDELRIQSNGPDDFYEVSPRARSGM